LNAADIFCVKEAPLQRTPSASLLLSSWLGAYGSFSLQRSSTSTCVRASIFVKRHSFDNLLQLSSSIDLSDAFEALLKFDDASSFSSGTTRVVLITIASAILISLRQSGKASAQRIC
jgi:hypothetical protein